MLGEMWRITVAMAPWLLLGAAVAGAAHAVLPTGLLRRRMAGSAGVVRAVALGVPLPLCSCAVIPVGIGLKKQGADDGAAVGFLISTPQTGVDSILVTASLLGWPLALFKVAVAVVTGLVGGFVTQRVVADSSSEAALPTPVPKPDPSPAIVRALRHADELIRSIWRWLVLGVVVSAAIAVAVPANALAELAAAGPGVAMGAALLVSLPLYVCATASAPVAAALVASGLPLGAAIVFLMAGPATNVATIGAVYRGLGARALSVYLTTIVVGSIAGGLLFEGIYGASASESVAVHHHMHGAPWWAHATATLLVAWMFRCAWVDARRRWRRPVVQPSSNFVSVESLSRAPAATKLTDGDSGPRATQIASKKSLATDP